MVAFRSGVLSEEELRSCVAAFLPDVDLVETRIPFAPLTVDLLSGWPHLLEKGPIVEAVMASCAVPGFMPPVRIEDAVLMDGGLAELIPAEAAITCGADTVIGVDVGIDICDACELSDGIDAINRATEIMSYHLGNPGRRACDLLLKPLDDHVTWTDFRGYKKLIQLGEAATEAVMEDIRGLVLKKPGGKWKMFNFFSEKKPRPATHG
jgi:NTE family protein